jgi:PAS domain S-box-containing protein
MRRFSSPYELSSDTLGRLASGFGIGVAVTDTDGGNAEINQRWLELARLERAPKGRGWIASFHPEDRAQVEEALQAALAAGNAESECRMRRDDGSVAWLHLRVFRARAHSGDGYSLIVGISDISGLRQLAARHEAIVGNRMVGIYVLEGERIAYASPRLQEMWGYGVEDMKRVTVLELVADESREVVRTNIRERMSGKVDQSSYSFKARRRDGSTFDVRVDSLRSDLEGRPIIIGLAQDISEHVRAERALESYMARFEASMVSTVETLSRMESVRDLYTAGHQTQVGLLAEAIGSELSLDHDRVTGLHMAAILHDVGKIGVPIEILTKPAALTSLEMAMVREHSAKGHEILHKTDSIWPLARVAFEHHERLDGTGYPRGLKGSQILLESQITTVADIVEAMVAHRPYRPGFPVHVALDEVVKGRGKAFNPDAVDACVKVVSEGRVKLGAATPMQEPRARP